MAVAHRQTQKRYKGKWSCHMPDYKVFEPNLPSKYAKLRQEPLSPMRKLGASSSARTDAWG